MRRSAIAIFAVTAMLSACSIADGYRTSVSIEEQETEYSSVYAEVTEWSGFKNKEYQSQLNEEIATDVSEAINEFDKLAAETAPLLPEGVKPALSIKQIVMRNSGGIISFVTENYTYLGGAHGTTSWSPYTADVLSESPHDLELRELFTNEDDYIDTINRIIDELIEADPEKYSELWADPHITEDDQDRYYLTDEELVIFYEPYELSYYAKGFIEFPIRLTEINGILKDPFKAEK